MDGSDDVIHSTSTTETFKNHSIELLQQLNVQRTNSLFCDVVVRVGGSVDFSAHRCVLAAASAVFHTLVCALSQTNDTSMLILLDTLNATGLESIIEYIYTGLLQLSRDNVLDVLAAATFLQLNDVISTCQSFIGIHTKVYDVTNNDNSTRNRVTQHNTTTAGTVTGAASLSHYNNVALSTNVATLSVPVGRYSLRHRRQSTLDCQQRNVSHTTRTHSALQLSANNNNSSTASTTGTSTSITGSRTTGTSTNTTSTDAAVVTTCVDSSLKRRRSKTVSQDTNKVLKPELRSCQLNSAAPAVASGSDDDDGDYYMKHETISVDDLTDLTRLSVCTELDSFVLDAYTGIQMDSVTNQQPTNDGNVSIHDSNLAEFAEIQLHSSMEHITDRYMDSDDCFICQNSSDFSSGGKFGMLDGASFDGGSCIKSPLKKRLKMKRGGSSSGGNFLQPCPTCGRKFTLASVLTRHMRKHSTKTYSCTLCDAIFLDPTTFKRHSILLHKERNVFVCPHDGCKFRSDRLSNVEKHATIHSTNHSFSCSRCGRTFAQENGLQSHLQSCLELRSFLCDLCGKAFNHLQSMQSHRRIHTSEKPFQCTQCSAQFTDHRNYKRHRRIHDNTFPYTCVICDKHFRHSNSLKSHLASHSILPNVDVKVNPPSNISLG